MVARIPPPRFSTLLGLACAAGLAAAPPAGGESGPPSAILGTWYVLVHYRDQSTAHPEALHWLDLVWTFEARGSRLEWTEYPIVVLDDDTGRFETTPGNPRTRVLAAWEPDAGQQRDIDAGPRVNSRGAKTKTLRGSDASGWHSDSRRSTGSPLVVGYKEILHVTGLPDAPVFEREDVLGNGARSSDEGSIRYETQRVLDGGARFEGRYTRDGIKHGVFRMWRTPAARGLEQKAGTPNERQAEDLRRALREATRSRPGEGRPESEPAIREEPERDRDDRP